MAVVGDEEKGSGRWPRFSGPQGIAHNGWAVWQVRFADCVLVHRMRFLLVFSLLSCFFVSGIAALNMTACYVGLFFFCSTFQIHLFMEYSCDLNSIVLCFSVKDNVSTSS